MTKDGEIVGLKASNNGRSCESHACCGSVIIPDDLVRFKLTIAEVNGVAEEAIKAVRIRDGTETCTIGFLPRNVVVSDKAKYIGAFAQVLELYEHSENIAVQRKNKRNAGMCSFRLLSDVQEQV